MSIFLFVIHHFTFYVASLVLLIVSIIWITNYNTLVNPLKKQNTEEKNEEYSNKEKEQAALEVGHLLVFQILENTEDRTGLIESCKKGGTITLKTTTDDLIEEVLEWMPTMVIVEEKEVEDEDTKNDEIEESNEISDYNDEELENKVTSSFDDFENIDFDNIEDIEYNLAMFLMVAGDINYNVYDDVCGGYHTTL